MLDCVNSPSIVKKLATIAVNMHSDFVLINSNSIINLNATHIYVQCSKLMNQEHDVGMLFASYQS